MSNSKKILEQVARDFNEQEALQKAEEIADKIEQATGLRPTMGQAPKVPDHPPCDCCGKDFQGKLSCAKCHSVYYCSRECQKRDWKRGGHKAACDTMKETCQQAAQDFVDAISDLDTPISVKMRDSLWAGVDGAGAYKIALSLGLNKAIEGLMQEEIDLAEIRFEIGAHMFSYTQLLMCTLFRGGRHIPGGVFSNMDAHRVSSYVMSSPTAFEKWFLASLKMITIFVTDGMETFHEGDQRFFWTIQKMARDIASAWTLVFTSSEASKAILLGITQDATDESTQKRAKWIIQQLKVILPKFPDDSPDNSAIEGQVNTFTAMIQVRLEEFGIDIGGDYVKLLGLKGMAKQMYYNIAVPFAKGTIAKGKSLTTAECQEVLMRYARS